MVLGKLGHDAKPAVPALAEALKDKSGEVRQQAAQVLGLIGADARAAIPALQEAAKDPLEEVASAAADALKRIQESK